MIRSIACWSPTSQGTNPRRTGRRLTKLEEPLPREPSCPSSSLARNRPWPGNRPAMDPNGFKRLRHVDDDAGLHRRPAKRVGGCNSYSPVPLVGGGIIVRNSYGPCQAAEALRLVVSEIDGRIFDRHAIG